MGGLLSSLAPYLVYRIAACRYGFQDSLANLTPRRLLALIAIYAIASPLLHHLWFWIHKDVVNPLPGFVAMAVGDLSGALLVVYTAKAVLSLFPRLLRPQRT